MYTYDPFKCGEKLRMLENPSRRENISPKNLKWPHKIALIQTLTYSICVYKPEKGPNTPFKESLRVHTANTKTGDYNFLD